MLSATQLFQTLNYQNGVYNAPGASPRIALLASKASILEVCGWIEQAMDLMVSECAGRCGLTPARVKTVEEDYVLKTYGFQYKQHFERMLIAVVGFRVLEQVEGANSAQIATLKAKFGSFTALRNHYAHTHFDDLKPYPQGHASIPTPSVMISEATTVHSGLTAIELALIASGC